MKTASRRNADDLDAAIACEVPIRKAIRNQTILYEVDRARQRDMSQWVVIGIVVAFVLVFSAVQHFELRIHGYRVEELQRERAAEEEINRQLRLELESLRDLSRIERYATDRLGLVHPGRDDMVILPRVEPAGLPAGSVVAAR